MISMFASQRRFGMASSSRSVLLCSSIGTVVLLLAASFAAIGANFAPPPHDYETVAKLPNCGNADQRDASRRLLFVSTLDGSITALDLTAGGQPRWTLRTGPDALLSSSIHRFELTSDGRMVRMIPSLYGGLYKFDGDAIEQIPVTADHLLSSSYKFSEDLVMSGGKETRSYGVSARTGRVVYECSIHGCRNHTTADDDDDDPSVTHGPPRLDEPPAHDPLIDDIVLVRRETQTVRAVESRTGGERWNFSVGHHELELLKPHECQPTQLMNDEELRRRIGEQERSDADRELRVLVAEGLVRSVHRTKGVEWEHRFEHPIVNAWRVNAHDALEPIDVFGVQQFPQQQQRRRSPDEPAVNPSLYVGMYQRQLYVQESDALKQTMLANRLDSSAIGPNNVRIPWKPQYAAIEADAEPPAGGVSEPESTSLVSPVDERATALSILYASEYANGNGFYLYTAADLNRTSLCKRYNGSTGVATDDREADDDPFGFADDDTTTKIVIVSVWFWWKEIMVIALTTALVMNVVLSRRLTAVTTTREVVIVERHVEVQVPMPVPSIAEHGSRTDGDSSAKRRSASESQNSDSAAAAFVSRYQTDFEMLRCLGRGGFGVVFESKNKLDDCKYAIKRIQLPSRRESRDRVMREVKTLAHCEHQNIVRYFQAWVEMPPPGWQEREDRIWMEHEAMSHSVDIDSPTMDDEEDDDGESSLAVPSSRIGDGDSSSFVVSKAIDRRQRGGLDAWITSLNTNECLNFDEDNRKTSLLERRPTIDNQDDDDDSFIQFRDDESNSAVVFAEESGRKARKTKPSQTKAGPMTPNDSFRIVFQHPSCASSSGPPGDWSAATTTTTEEQDDEESIDNHADDHATNDDSFSIEFRHSANGAASSNGDGLALAIKKPRALSETMDSTNSVGSGSAVFRRTHRRPQSLDLTSAIRQQRRKAEVVLDLYPAVAANRMYLYIQMQLCKKQSLKDWLRLNDLQSRRRDIVHIFRQIVDGVEYCHLKGLIHRDLKPGNIFFAMDGQIKIGDFGLVTGMADEMPQTPCGHLHHGGKTPSAARCFAKHTQQVGTQLYMSPEQLAGEQYSYKVDVYSLGLIFFELLRVFGTEMERIETLKALRAGSFPRDFVCDYHDEFMLLQLMLSERPDERPTTIGIRARPPLGTGPCNSNTEWHFTLPPRRRDSDNLNASAALSRHASSTTDSANGTFSQ